jgi:cation transport ATPase
VVFPLYYLLSQRDCSLFIALLYSLCYSSVIISIAIVVGLALVSSILIAGKPLIRTNYWQELSRAPLTTAFLIGTTVLSSYAVSARERSSIALIVQCFPLLKRGVVYS